MARFFVEKLPAPDSVFELTGENAAHAKVLRLNPGEAVTLCDGAGLECGCTLTEGLRLLAGETVPSPAEPRAAVTVWIAFPKADKAEHVIQKATELGAAEIVLFPSRFCVSRPDDKSLGKKLERWQKIARAAAEQSGRGRIPRVRAVDSFAEALRQAAEAELPILFYEHERARTLKEAMEAFLRGHGGLGSGRPTDGDGGRTNPPHPSAPAALPPSPQGEGFDGSSIALMTGAEGGFAAEEIARAEAAGLRICTLGPRILRCETAPLAALSAVMFALGEL